MTQILEAESATHPDEHHAMGLRAQRRRKRRRRNRMIAAFVAGTLIAAGVATVGYFRWRNDAVAATSAATETPTAAANDVTQLATAPARTRPLTADNPLRLWIGGDSLAGALGPSLGDITAATGVVQPQFESRVSSGLDNNGIVNWAERATEEIARLNPEVIVFIIGTNDFPVGLSDSALAEYEAKADNMMSILTSGNRPVYWIGPPVLRDARMSRGAERVNELFQRIAPRHPSLTFVDAYKLFATADGAYTAKMPDANGKEITVRAGDGVHFTDAGGDLLAKVVFELMDPVWKISAQAVSEQAKPVFETPGSNRVPVNQGRRTTPATNNGNSGQRSTATTEAPPSTRAATTSTAARATTSTAPPATSVPPRTTAPPAATAAPSTTAKPVGPG